MPVALPSTSTPRLLLRPFEAGDAPELQRLAGHIEIARGTLTIPHPYPDGAAEEWIAAHAARFESEGHIRFAIVTKGDDALAGSIGLVVNREHARAEIGYWIGVDFWGRGYAVEAARATIDYGFGEANLNRIFGVHFANNPASGHVLQKVGMRHEGTHRQAFRKWGEFLDAEMYAILRSEWEAARTSSRSSTPPSA